MEVQETLGGRYKLLHELGTGGMAVVWRARDEVLGRPVAVKVLAGRFAGDPQSRARIRDEARAAATLSHPNIAQVYDYGESTDGDESRPYVVMELVNGPTLQQRVASAPLPPRTIFRICGEVAAALAAAHADGLVHRDIKMANIMVTATGAKVVDFGIAAAVGPAAPEEMLVGTPAYLAPERLTGDAVQPASDVYALGVLLYRLLAHEPPWTVETTTQMLNAHIYVEPSPMPALPGVPLDVADLIDRCLRKNPAHRPSAAEVSATLGDAAEASLLSVREESPRPVLPAPRAVDGEFDELTSASIRRGPRGRDEAPGRRGRMVPGRAGMAPADSTAPEIGMGAGSASGAGSVLDLPSAGSAGEAGSAAADGPGSAAGWAAGAADLDAGSGAGSGAAAMFVPGAEIGGVREPLPGDGVDGPDRRAAGGGGAAGTRAPGGRRRRDDDERDGAAGGAVNAGPGGGSGRGPANTGPGAGVGGLDDAERAGNGRSPRGSGHDRNGRDQGRRGVGGRGPDNERDGTRIERHLGQPGGGGSWIPEARPGSVPGSGRAGAVGGESDPVRKKRLKFALAGGGVAAVLAAVLILWGLSEQSGQKAQTPSGNVDGVVAAPPSGAVRPAPSVSGDGSATLPDGTTVTGHPALGVSGRAASLGPSAAASATSTEGTPQPSGSAASLAPSVPVGTRLTSAGGTVYAVCGQGKAQLTGWEPAPGYTVQKVNQGPAIAPEVVFKGASARYRMTVTCVAGTPTPLVLPL